MMKIFRVQKRHHGMTVLEVLLAVSLFAMLFIAIFGYFQQTSRQVTIDAWRANQKKFLATKLPLLKQDFEKASYPSAVFLNNTVIYDGGSLPTDTTADSDPGEKHYVRYLEGTVMGTASTKTKLLSWYICKPTYDSAVQTYVSKETWDQAQGRAELLCELYLENDPSQDVPRLVYYRGSTSNGSVMATGVESVTIEGHVIKPPGYEHYKDATYGSGEKKYNPWDDQGTINLTIKLSTKFSQERVYDYGSTGKDGDANRANIIEKVTLKSAVKILSL